MELKKDAIPELAIEERLYVQQFGRALRPTPVKTKGDEIKEMFYETDSMGK